MRTQAKICCRINIGSLAGVLLPTFWLTYFNKWILTRYVYILLLALVT